MSLRSFRPSRAALCLTASVATGGYFVRNVDEYYRQVVVEIQAQGLCATVDGGGEIAVKQTNDFNDQYHIMISDGHIRRGEASYRATCYPAWF